MRSIFLVLVILLVLTACDSGKVYQEVHDFSNKSWAFQDVQRFEVNMQDTANPYLLLVNLRNTTAYPYSNLWLFITRIEPSGFAKTDTVECPLAAPSGKWLGKGTGDLVDHLILFKKDYKFPKPGNYTFKVQHGMRIDTLNEIASVGIRVQKGYK